MSEFQNSRLPADNDTSEFNIFKSEMKFMDQIVPQDEKTGRDSSTYFIDA